MLFRFLHNFFIHRLCDVISGNSINNIAQIHDPIIVIGFRNSIFENSSCNQILVDIKYHIPCANAKVQQRIPSHCLTDTIFLRCGPIFVLEKISASGLEKTIISSVIRAILANRLCSSGKGITSIEVIDKQIRILFVFFIDLL